MTLFDTSKFRKAFKQQTLKRLQSMFSMRLNEKAGFLDRVTGKTVRYYTDKFGEEYMAEYRYWPFKYRTKVNQSTK